MKRSFPADEGMARDRCGGARRDSTLPRGPACLARDHPPEQQRIDGNRHQGAAISVSSAIRASTPSATASVPRERELADLRRARIDAVSTCQTASDVSATFAQSAAADVAKAATSIAIALRIADRS
jgi:hypothetical protein